MESSTDWNVEAYRKDYESDEHWHLRRDFMLAHKELIPEDRLVCLAQVFVNVEFMGCKYPAETMRQVAELSKDVAKDFRAKRANKLKRTFVAASDAAEQRVKARSSGSGKSSTAQHNNQGENKQQKRKCFGTGEWEQQEAQSPAKQSVSVADLFNGLEFGKLILTLSGGRNCLTNSAQRSKVSCVFGEVSKTCAEIKIADKKIASATADSIKEAKLNAFNKALELLQKKCFSIKPNPAQDRIQVSKSNNKVDVGVLKQKTAPAEAQKLDSTNKGYKMMKMMGWTGGGLGSKTQGRTEPVEYLLKNNRQGLGSEGCDLDHKYFRKMLSNYASSDDIRDIQFEASFSKDERATIHKIAQSINLKSASHNSKEERSLRISKKTITDQQILEEVLIHKNQKFLNKFLVQVPESLADEYPDHAHKLDLDP